MADADAASVREEDGRLYAGNPERAYTVSLDWSERVVLQKFRYSEKYDREYLIQKKYIAAKMSFERDDICILGSQFILNTRNEADVFIAPTSQTWIPSAVEEYNWTLNVDYFEGIHGTLSLPVEVFESVVAKVLAGQVDSLSVWIRGGFWVDQKNDNMPDRYKRTLYLRPNKDRRDGSVEAAICRVEELQVKCGAEPIATSAAEEAENREVASHVVVEQLLVSHNIITKLIADIALRTHKQNVIMISIITGTLILLSFVVFLK